MDYMSLPKVQNLTEAERTVLDSIIRQMKTEGNFSKLDELWKVDYEEIPVSIDRFLEDDRYMGKVFQNGKLIYPFWREQLRYIFEENPDNAFEIIISGAIGCVSGDTKVRLLDNRILSVKEMAESDETSFWVYSWDTVNDCWKPGLATNVHKSGISSEVIKINLSNDLSVIVTPNHPFLLTTGVYVEARDLKPGDSIQSLYLYTSKSKFYNGYICYGNEQPIHRHIAKSFNPDVEFTKSINVHHKDHCKTNNTPDNLQIMLDVDHLDSHRKEYWSHEENHTKRSEEVSDRMYEYLSKLMSDSRYSEFWETSENRAILSNRMIKYNKEEHPNLRKDITIELITDTAIKINSTSTYKIAEELNCSMSKVATTIYKKYGNKLNWITNNNLPINKIQESKLYDHTVISVEKAANEDVYDLTVDGYHNYGISDKDGNLIFTHNTGKSTISAIGMMYLIYRTLCLKDPQKFYGLTANSPIVFVCLNLTLELAYNGLYSMIVEAIKLSPWFQEKVDIRGRYDFSIEFPKNLQLITASNVQHTIGKNVLGAILDELNFSNAPKGSKNSVLDMYRNIRRRLESRFLKQGRIPGFLFLVSSKNTEYDFLEQYIQTIKDNKTAYLIDKAVYDIKPPETYVGTKFKVAVGDKTKSSRIIGDQEDVGTILELGYKVIEVPTEYRIAFEQDINDALKDIAGISSVSTSKLIPYAGKIEACINKSRKSPLLVDEITLSLDTEENIKDYLDDLRILKKDLHIPRFGHIDIGLKGDSLGFCLVHAVNTVSVERYSKNGKILSFLENKYQADLELRVRPLSGSEVPLYKIREFILYLVTSLGIHIQMLTFDGFQSSDSIQLLKTAGLDVGLLSVDRTDEQYLNLRSCILEGRLDLYDQPTLIKELYELDHDIKNKKVDHPISGSKDISDALCGAIWNAQKYYAGSKQSNVVQHQNVKQAVEFINTLNKKRWVDDKIVSDDNWLFKD